MALSLITPQSAKKRLNLPAAGAGDSHETLSDYVRAEVHARGCAQRSVTLSRVTRLLVSVAAIEQDRLDEICNTLQREGDLMLAPGGMLYATPTRVVVLNAHARVFGSLPTQELVSALGQEVNTHGVARTVAVAEGLAEAVSWISGVMVSPEVWAGLEYTPYADAAFIQSLEQRLNWETLRAGSLDSGAALDWRTWDLSGENASWRRSDKGRLWWARTRFGGHHRAWTEGGSPLTSKFVELSADDADRARFALSRGVGKASTVVIQRSGPAVTLELPTWLPRPEYRWLSLHAKRLPDGKDTLWEVAPPDEAQITQLLTERLGLVLEVQ